MKDQMMEVLDTKDAIAFVQEMIKHTGEKYTLERLKRDLREGLIVVANPNEERKGRKNLYFKKDLEKLAYFWSLSRKEMFDLITKKTIEVEQPEDKKADSETVTTEASQTSNEVYRRKRIQNEPLSEEIRNAIKKEMQYGMSIILKDKMIFTSDNLKENLVAYFEERKILQKGTGNYLKNYKSKKEKIDYLLNQLLELEDKKLWDALVLMEYILHKKSGYLSSFLTLKIPLFESDILDDLEVV